MSEYKSVSAASLIEDGYLCDARYFMPAEDSLLDADIGQIVEAYKQHGAGKRAIVFCASVAQANTAASLFVTNGIPAACLSAARSPQEQAGVLAMYRNDNVMVLTTCSLMLEQPFPETEVVILAKPTRSRSRYFHMVASGLRPNYAEGMPLDTAEQRRAAIAASRKTQAIVLDLDSNTKRHGMITS